MWFISYQAIAIISVYNIILKIFFTTLFVRKISVIWRKLIAVQILSIWPCSSTLLQQNIISLAKTPPTQKKTLAQLEFNGVNLVFGDA